MGLPRIFIVFDTESTGLRRASSSLYTTPASISIRGDEVCQIGGLVLDSELVPKKLFCHYCDIVAASSGPEALQVHGIQQQDVRRYIAGQFLPEVMQRWLPEFFNASVIFIGYNVEFDMSMVAQTLSNSCLPFPWKKLSGNILPKKGRYSVDVAEFLRVGTNYRRLNSFDRELLWSRELFINKYEKILGVDTNCIDLLRDTWNQEHNAFFDALNTYLLWRDKVWKKKLF